jgi:hypothetical protein
MQPAWREGPEGDTLVRTVPADEDWTPLIRGGSNGLSLVVMALSWWVSALDAPDSDLSEAISDVKWVLSELVTTLSSPMSETGNKRPCESSPDDEPDSKR